MVCAKNDEPVRTFTTSLTIPFDEERADVWPVAFVVGIRPCELLQHLLSGSRRLARVQQTLVAFQLFAFKHKSCDISTILQRNKGRETHLPLHILRIILPINLARRRLILQLQRRIPNLRGQPILQIQETRLADILNLCASLADDGSLVTHACARVPAEDGEGASTGATRAAIFLF